MEGYVYILMNSAFPDLVKIGRTSKSPQARASELSNTGTPNKFIVIHSVFTKDCIALEDRLHREFDEHRYNKDREFFCVRPAVVIKKIEDFLGVCNEDETLDSDDNYLEVVIYQAVLDNFGTVRIGLLDKSDKYFINTINGPKECLLNTYLYSEDFKIILFEYYDQLDWQPSLILEEIQVLRNQEFILSQRDFEYFQNIGLSKLIFDLFNSETVQDFISNKYFLSDPESAENNLYDTPVQLFIDGRTLRMIRKYDKQSFLAETFFQTSAKALESFQERFKKNKLKMQENKYQETMLHKINSFPKKI